MESKFQRDTPAARTATITPASESKSRVGSVSIAQLPTKAELHERISQLAYYKAQARGFEAGHEWDDWLAAEREVTESALPQDPRPL